MKKNKFKRLKDILYRVSFFDGGIQHEKVF